MRLMRWIALLFILASTAAYALTGGGRIATIGGAWTPDRLGPNLLLWVDPSNPQTLHYDSGSNLADICYARDVYPNCSAHRYLHNGAGTNFPTTAAYGGVGAAANYKVIVPGGAGLMSITPSITSTNVFTCWFVVKMGTATAPFGNSAAYVTYPFFLATTTIYVKNGGAYASGTWAGGTTGYHVVMARSNGGTTSGSLQLTMDGSPIVLGAPTTGTNPQTWDQAFDGQGGWSDGSFGEMFCSSAAESAATDMQAKKYLKAKWQTP